VGLDDSFDLDIWKAQFGVKELGDMALEMPAAQTSPKSDRLSSEAILGILSPFSRKSMNIKVEYNFLAHNLDTKFVYLESVHGRYDADKEALRIRKIWTRLILWKPSLLLSRGGSRTRQGGARPKAPQRYK
jgi:hypothetical protein